MVENRYHLIVNIKSKTFGSAVPTVTANDNTIFEVEVYDDAEPFSLSSTYTYHLVTMKKNKTSIIREGTFANGILSFPIGTSETTEEGKVEGTVQIYDANMKRISSAPISYFVKKDPSLNGSLPADETRLVIANESLFQETIQKTDEQKQRVDDLIAGTPQPSEVVDARGGFGVLRDRLNSVDASLAQNSKQKADKLPFLFGTNYEQIQSKTYDQIYDISTLTAKLQGSVYYGFDGAWIVTEIKPVKAQIDAFTGGTLTQDQLTLQILPSVDYITQMITMIKSYNLPILGIKLHNNWMNSSWASLTPSVMFPKYQAVINSLIAAISPNDVPRMTILNESSTIVTDANSTSLINNMLSSIKSAGFKTGIEGINYNLYSVPASIMNTGDIVSLHYYPHISSKLDKTTLNDVLTAWDCTGFKDTVNGYYRTYPTKEFWIVESGVQNYWEALRAPENYFSSGTTSPNNEVQTMFFEGLFNHFKECSFLSGVCTWYFDYGTYPLMKQLFQKYGKVGS